MTAPAPAPPAETARTAPHAGPGPTVLPLPAELAAAVDALDAAPVHPVRVRHPRTGEVFRLVPEAVARPFTPAEKAEYDAGVSDREAILQGIAEADAGLCRPWEESRAALLAEFPFLSDPVAVGTGGESSHP